MALRYSEQHYLGIGIKRRNYAIVCSICASILKGISSANILNEMYIVMYRVSRNLANLLLYANPSKILMNCHGRNGHKTTVDLALSILVLLRTLSMFRWSAPLDIAGSQGIRS